MRFSVPRSVTRLTASVALAGTLALAGGAALAQDATPATAPIDPATCVSPGLDGRLGSPAAASTMASPAAEDEAVIAEATAAVENLYACYNADGPSFLGLFTDDAFATYWGGVDPEVLAELNPVVDGQLVSNVEIHEVLDLGDGRFAIDYQVTVGYQVEHMTDIFAVEDGVWLVDANAGGHTPETSLDGTTASVKISEADGGHTIEVSPNPIMNQPAVKLQIANQTDDFLIVALLRGGDAASMPADLESAGLPEDVVILGTVAVEPGEHAIGLWEGLEEGDYVIFVETGHGTAAYDLTIDPPFDPNA
jgi:hypothetical protein